MTTQTRTHRLPIRMLPERVSISPRFTVDEILDACLEQMQTMTERESFEGRAAVWGQLTDSLGDSDRHYQLGSVDGMVEI